MLLSLLLSLWPWLRAPRCSPLRWPPLALLQQLEAGGALQVIGARQAVVNRNHPLLTPAYNLLRYFHPLAAYNLLPGW